MKELDCMVCKYKDSCRWKCILLSNSGIKKIKESDVVRIKEEDE